MRRAPSWRPPRRSATPPAGPSRSPELRQSEALGLQRSIHHVRGGGLIYEELKSKPSHRTLALPLPLVAELHWHKAAQLCERMLAGSEWDDAHLILAQPNGRPIDKKAGNDDWTPCCNWPASATSACTTAGTRRPLPC